MKKLFIIQKDYGDGMSFFGPYETPERVMASAVFGDEKTKIYRVWLNEEVNMEVIIKETTSH